jgi:purine nucleosidase
MSAGSPPAEKFLLDTDIGTDVDDALALVLAARSPEVEIVSVTTVGGKPHVRARIASKLLSLLGKQHVPVAAGLARPLPTDRYKVWFPDGLWMGHEGKGVLTEEEIADSPRGDGPGVDQIISTLLGTDERLTVVTIGPVSNFGAALKREPRIAAKVKQYIAMGGNVMGNPVLGGHELPPISEYNFNADREAAATALAAGIPTTLVPIELTIQTYLTSAEVNALRAEGDQAGKALADLLDVWVQIFQGIYKNFAVRDSTYGDWACHLHDPLAVLVLIRPELLSFADEQVSVKEENGVLLTRATPEGEILLRVATSVDLEAARAFILQRLKGEPTSGNR